MAPTKQLGDYKIEQEIGQGGMATIYRALDTRTNRVVVVKVLMPHWARDLVVLRRFQKEGENAQHLQHPNIAQVYEAGQAEGQHFIVMQYASHGALDRLLQQRKRHKQAMSVAEVIAYLRPIAAALDYAHSQGILHRDIKPSNVLIDDDEQLLLSDFGIARRLDPTATQLTMTNQTLGTPAYMSPEQAEGDSEIAAAADIYSLGVMAYEMLTNELPFTASNSTKLLQKILDEPPAAPETFNPRLAPGVTFALRKVLAKDPGSRYPSASEFLNALERGLTWSPRPSDWATLTTGTLPAATPSRKFGEPVATHRSDRRRWVGAGLALVGVVAIAFAAYSLGQQRAGPASVGGAVGQATVPVAITPTQQAGGVALNPTVAPTAPSTPTTEPTATAAVPTDSATAPSNLGVSEQAAVLATSTPAPTSTSVPSPTPNLEATTAAQQVPTQTATAGAIATTAVAEPATATPVPMTSTATATATPIPNTATATATPTWTVTATPVPMTSTATATATPIPNTATPIATATPTWTAMPTPIQIVVPDQRIVRLISPMAGEVAEVAKPKRMLLFKWEVAGAIPAGYCTELVFRFKEHIFALKDVTGQTEADINLNMVADILKLTSGNDWFDWGVRVVSCGAGGEIKPHEWRQFRYAQ